MKPKSPYGGRWQKRRRSFLMKYPWCAMCAAGGYVEPATVVDHKVPHKGDWHLFWDEANWQPLCGPHHSATKQRMEARAEGPLAGAAIGCDAAGLPIDPAHPWFRQRVAGR